MDTRGYAAEGVEVDAGAFGVMRGPPLCFAARGCSREFAARAWQLLYRRSSRAQSAVRSDRDAWSALPAACRAKAAGDARASTFVRLRPLVSFVYAALASPHVGLQRAAQNRGPQ
eukprot:CAMPEP_0176257078 /NCGR_PEP_ID=MMETSP0121_2-20121125/37865_1 /TAXON_ID=160619 /ORGANISM="Kryptoperidinium foliaceum, Strain CCMP 1326" /LENGTH=114 /DNA_ID=CAMNT_0017596913 /DNA_START=23 /DNA_END=365 /DNA_ORIENTATION=-